MSLDEQEQQEILAKWRKEKANPHLSLSAALGLEKTERQFAHLGKTKQRDGE